MFGLFKKAKKKKLFDEISQSNKLSVKLISLLGQGMMYADGTADEEEAKPLIMLSAENGVSPAELKEFSDKVGKHPDLIPGLVKLLTYTERKLVIQTLGMIMIMDGEVHDNELDYLVRVGAMMNMDEDKVVKIYQAKIKELAQMQENDEEVEELLSSLSLEQRFAIFFILIKIAESDGYTDEERIALEDIAVDLNIKIDDFNNSKIDGLKAIDLLKDLSETHKLSLTKLITLIVGADGEFSAEESSWVLDIVSQLGLDVNLMTDLVEKYWKKENDNETIDNTIESNQNEENKLDETDAPDDNSMLSGIYPNLKGIDFNNVNLSFDMSTHKEFFLSDIDGRWRYATSQMTMLFKAFSKDRFDVGLADILKSNGIAAESVEQKPNFKAWKGNGFQVEHIIVEEVDIIVITNEDIVPKDSMHYATTDLASKVKLPAGYENLGFENLYDGDECLKKNNGTIPINVPFIFNDSEDDSKFILIKVTTLTLAKHFIDEINEKTFGSLEKGDDTGGWNYFHFNKFFTIGYLEEHMCVRINLLHNLVGVGESNDDVIEQEITDIADDLGITIYDEGDLVTNPFTGDKYELNNIELSVYDFLMGSKMVFEMGQGKNPDLDDVYQKGLKWFKDNNLEAYNILLK